MSDTKHTPGAVRAAEALWEDDTDFSISNVSAQIEHNAAIIDQETGLPELQARIDRLEAEKAELLETCKLAEIALRDHPQYDNLDDEPSLEAIGFEACRAAIARATKQTTEQGGKE